MDDVSRPAGLRALRRLAAHLDRKQRFSITLLAVTLIGGSGALMVIAPKPAGWSGAVSLLPDRTRPSVITAHRRTPIELGLRFRTSTRAEAIAVQFYKGPHNRGTHRATLWTASGKRLARVTFRRETSSGLQTARFKRPVRLRAHRSYVISYTAPQGAYSVDRHYFTHRVARRPLSAKPRAGVYSNRPGAFPTKTDRASNYTVDIVVRPVGSSAQPPAPPASHGSPPPTTPTDDPTGQPSDQPSDQPTQTPSEEPGDGTPTDFPSRDTTGVPDGWTPQREVVGDYVVDTTGEVVEDLRVTNGVLYVRAPGVTLRRVEVVGGRIVNDYAGRCHDGLRIEDTSIRRGERDVGLPVIESGGYTAVRLELDGVTEGVRVGEKDQPGCGPVVLEDSYFDIQPPEDCANVDWHGDGIQGYRGAELTVRHSTIKIFSSPECIPTSAFFYPDQENTRVTVEDVLVAGGGYVFRIGTPGRVSGLKVLDDTWIWGPVDVDDCGIVEWGAGNAVVSAGPDGSLRTVRPLPCINE